MSDSAQPQPGATPPPASPGEGGLAPLHKIIVALLALAFPLLSPLVFNVGWDSFNPNWDYRLKDRTGNELVGDGLALVQVNEALVASQKGFGNLGQTLTTPWWGESINANQALYRPLSTFLLGVAGAVSGGVYEEANPGSKPFPYHAIRVGLKVLCALLVLELAFLITRNSRMAFLSGALFATLPVHGEVLFDAAGTAELLATAFSLGAWMAWIRAGDEPLKRPGQLALALGLLFAATLSKESAFALPLVFFLMDIGLSRAASFGAGVGAALKKLPALIACGVVLALSLALRYAVLGRLRPDYLSQNWLDNPLLEVGFLERFMNGLRIMMQGIGGMLGINTLSSDWHYAPDYSYGQIPVHGAFAVENLIGLALLLALVLGAIALYRKCSIRAALLLVIPGAMLVTSNLLFGAGTIYGDRLMFFPSVALVILVAACLAPLGKPGVLLGLLLSIGGGVWTIEHAHYWVDQTELWKFAKNKSATDAARVHYNFGVDLAKDALPGLAAESFERATEIFPRYADAYHALGQTYILPDNQDLTKASAALQRSVEIQLEDQDWTYRPEAIALEGSVRGLLYTLTQLRVFAESELVDPAGHLAWLQGLLDKGYESPYVYQRMGDTHYRLAELEAAEVAYRKSLSIYPTAECVKALGKFLLDSGRTQDALDVYNTQIPTSSTGERVEILVWRGQAEALVDPDALAATIEELKTINRQGDYTLAPEQLFRMKILQAQYANVLGSQTEGAGTEYLQQMEQYLMQAVSSWQQVTSEVFEARRMLATVQYQLGKHEDARRIFEELVRYQDLPSMRAYLANIYARLDRHEDALDQIQRALPGFEAAYAQQGDPYRVPLLEARTLLISSLRELDRSDEAYAQIDTWHSSVEAEYDSLALYLHAGLLGTEGELDEALKIAGLLVSEFPEGSQDHAAGLQLVTSLSERQALETAFADGSADADQLSLLGEARAAFQDRAGALEAWRRALELLGEDDERRPGLQARVQALESSLQ